MLRLLLVAFLAVLPLSEQVARFDNYKVYRVIPSNEEQLNILAELESLSGYSIWSLGRDGRPVDIMVPPHLDDDFTGLVKSQGMEASVYIENVQERIDNENPPHANTKASELGWTSYHRIDAIYSWLRELARDHPNTVQLINAGSTYEGRQILGVYVSFSSANRNRGVVLEGGIHAREWIAPATATYIINELLTSTDSSVRSLAESYDWYIFPSVNPDGYEYTHTNNRLWRKTRTPYSILCYGADPNRNWSYLWNRGGTSDSPCSETYRGPRAFSEIETETFSRYISTIASRVTAYISIHSYSQLILIPYGVDGVSRPSNYNVMLAAGNRAATAIRRRYGTAYTVGNIVDVLYTASGSTIDYMKGVYNVNLTYTFELRDTGLYGFVLPASQIIPTAQETLDGFVALLS